MDGEHGQTQVIIIHHVHRDDKLDNDKPYSNKKCLYYFTFAGILVSIALIFSTLPILTMRYLRNRNSSDIITHTEKPLHIISREAWIAQPPLNKLEQLQLPVPQVIIAHTGTENCTTQAECTFQVRTLQLFHIEARGWDDIGYNFLVGGDGAIYVGRGWDYIGAHTKGYNENSICFAFIGTFNTIEPPERQLIAAQKMLLEGVRLKKLTADYALYGHRQFFPTLSPGTALYEIIKKWAHWTEDIRKEI